MLNPRFRRSLWKNATAVTTARKICMRKISVSLSWLELGLGYGDDYLVLNSVSLLERSFPILDRYERINCYLDRDAAGRRTLEALRKRYADKLVDCSSLYKGYKDLNEYLQHKFL